MANLVSQGFHEVSVEGQTLKDLDFTNLSPSLDRITSFKLKSLSSKESVQAWVLPKHILSKWPHIQYDLKQSDTISPHILFRRDDMTSIGREEQTMKFLLMGKPVIWIGLPGIGKTMATMVMLVRTLQLMRERQLKKAEVSKDVALPDGFDEVYYRLKNQDVFVFTWDPKSASFKTRKLTQKEWEKQSVSFRDGTANADQKLTLIVEMAETDVDPEESGLYSSSSRRIYEKTFKTFGKGGGRFFLMDPPSDDVLSMMYNVVSALDKESIPKHINSIDKFQELRNDIGRVPRMLFNSNYGQVKQYLISRGSQLKDGHGPLDDLKTTDISVSNVGPHLKYFMAPCIKPGVKVPLIWEDYTSEAAEYLSTLSDEERKKAVGDKNVIFEFRCLSEGCKLVLAQYVKTAREIVFLEEFGRPYELLECVIKYAGALNVNKNLIQQSVPERSRIDKWLWYSDPGPVKLLKEHAMHIDNVRKISSRLTELCIEERKVSGVRFDQKVWEMEENVLYVPIDHRFAVVEWLMVDHEKKIVFGHQMSMSTMEVHSFNTKTVDNVM
jgi:hypothetical protein